MRTVLKWGLLTAALVLIAMQFSAPDRTNPPTDPSERLEARVAVPGEVKAILDRSCRDCHTHETRWPWYSGIAPVSWLVAHDVSEGRDELNLSRWSGYSAEKAREQLEHICEEVREGKMPLSKYTLLHPGAKLSAADADLLCAWTDSARKQVAVAD